MRTAAYNDDVASVCASLRSLLNECHWHSATPQAPECALAHSLFIPYKNEKYSRKTHIFHTAWDNYRKGGGRMENRGLDCTAIIISAIGALNWGLIGLFKFNLVSWIFGDMSWITRIIYVVVGICGLYLLSFIGRTESNA